MKSFLKFSLILFLGFLMFQGCKKDPDPTPIDNTVDSCSVTNTLGLDTLKLGSSFGFPGQGSGTDNGLSYKYDFQSLVGGIIYNVQLVFKTKPTAKDYYVQEVTNTSSLIPGTDSCMVYYSTGTTSALKNYYSKKKCKIKVTSNSGKLSFSGVNLELYNASNPSEVSKFQINLREILVDECSVVNTLGLDTLLLGTTLGYPGKGTGVNYTSYYSYEFKTIVSGRNYNVYLNFKSKPTAKEYNVQEVVDATAPLVPGTDSCIVYYNTGINMDSASQKSYFSKKKCKIIVTNNAGKLNFSAVNLQVFNFPTTSELKTLQLNLREN